MECILQAVPHGPPLLPLSTWKHHSSSTTSSRLRLKWQQGLTPINLLIRCLTSHSSHCFWGLLLCHPHCKFEMMGFWRGCKGMKPPVALEEPFSLNTPDSHLYSRCLGCKTEYTVMPNQYYYWTFHRWSTCSRLLRLLRMTNTLHNLLVF